MAGFSRQAIVTDSARSARLRARPLAQFRWPCTGPQFRPGELKLNLPGAVLSPPSPPSAPPPACPLRGTCGRDPRVGIPGTRRVS
eukprot:9659383-Alexandrium_andersonii.AAC.1